MLNARSVRNKAMHIFDHIVETKTDIMIITESWLNDQGDEVTLNNLIPEGYTYELANRQNKRGGGILVIHRTSLLIKPSKTIVYKSFECLEIIFNTANSHYRFICIYRPPPSVKNKLTVNMFMSEFQQFLMDRTLLLDKMIMLGDFNFHVDVPADPDANKFLNILDSFNLRQHIHEPTHISGHTLDLVITNVLDESSAVSNIVVDQPGLSDHHCVQFYLNTLKPGPTRQTIQYRKTKSVNISDIKEDIIVSKLEDTIKNALTLDEKITVFNNTITEIMDKHAPLLKRTIVLRPNTQWYTKDIRNAKKRQRRAEKQWRKTKLQVHRDEFTKARNDRNTLVIQTKTNHVKDKITANKDNPKELFRIVDGLVKHSKPNNNLPSTIDANALATSFSTYFTSKIENIRKEMDITPLTSNNDGMPSASVSCDRFSPASEDEIQNILLHLPNKTCSLDAFPAWIAIQCANILTPILTHIVNLSLELGEVPCVLKRAVVKPLLKKNDLDKEDMNNYRPVSNLSFLSKIIEKVVVSRIQMYLKENNIGTEFQSAYKSNHSTETALLGILNDIFRMCAKKQPVMLLLLDLSAAFDTVDKDLLVRRLNNRFGFRDSAIKWLESYMTNRTMSVSIDANFSQPLPVKFGIPQGSVLGPILFTMYTAPLSDIINNYNIRHHLYADDTQIYVPFTQDSLTQVEECLVEVKTWMTHNKLKLNENKTEIMLCSKGSLSDETPCQLNFNGENLKIPTCTTVKNLGFYFDSRLRMEEHIKKTCQACHYHLRNIGKIRHMLSTDVAHMLAHCFITSRLDYCNSLLTGIPLYLKEKLQKIQNKAARIVVRANKTDESTSILQRLHWLPIDKRIDYKVACQVFKCLNGTAPSYLINLISRYEPPRSLRSSSQNLLVSGVPGSKFEERAFCFYAPIVWNNLSFQTRTCETYETFKKHLKTELFKKSYMY